MNKVYEIKLVRSSKDDIKQPVLAEQGVIPKLGSSIILSGKSGSGKSVLLHNLLTRSEFYKDWFDKVVIISPTAEQDDVQKALKIPSSLCFCDLDEAVKALKKIEQIQTSDIEKNGSARAKKIAIIYDDVVGHQKFMNSPEFIGSFIRSRHWNASVFLLTQSFMRVPRICRLQASYLCFFPMSRSEMERVLDEFCPPGITNKRFEEVLSQVLDQKYQFFTINMKAPVEERYRKGLAEVVKF